MKDDSEEKSSLKEKCVNCIKGPNLFKTVVIFFCFTVVVQQVTVCIQKLINMPITTYTHFDFNQTLKYPSVTFCREPPYKFQRLLDYGLVVHPRMTSSWRNFDFELFSLEQLWEDITYDSTEIFVNYGLNGSSANVDVIETRGFVLGTCFTLKPKVPTTKATKDTGYSVTLKHSAEDVATSVSIYPPGYHVYVHSQNEPFTEVEVNSGGLVDYMYVNIGEELDIKLTVDEYIKIDNGQNYCIFEKNYSANDCGTKYLWDMISDIAGCSGPWMISTKPSCANYTLMTNLIVAYINNYQELQNHNCPRFCKSLLYNGYVTNRQNYLLWDAAKQAWKLRSGEAELQIQLYLHFNSMMVSVYEESYNYDWNLFLSDLGGSIGFLLGLSVVGFLKIAEKMWASLVRPFIKTLKPKKDTTISEADTVAVKEREDYLSKCDDWSRKNEFYNTSNENFNLKI